MADDNVNVAESSKGIVEDAQKLTVQSYAREADELGWGAAGLLMYLSKAGEIVPPWWSMERDVELRQFWKRCDHLSSTIATLTAKTVSIPVHVEPRDFALKSHVRQADEFTRRLVEGAEFGQTWTMALSKWLEDYWCLAGSTRIHLGGDRRGQTKKIAQMVEDRDPGPVLSVNEDGHLVERAVIDWHENPLGARQWWWISLREASGHARDERGGIFVTEDHPDYLFLLLEGPLTMTQFSLPRVQAIERGRDRSTFLTNLQCVRTSDYWEYDGRHLVRVHVNLRKQLFMPQY